MTGIEIAGRVWSMYLTDNVTLNIHVGVSSGLGNRVIGGALSGIRASQSYLDDRNGLSSPPTGDRALTSDNLILNNMWLADPTAI